MAASQLTIAHARALPAAIRFATLVRSFSKPSPPSGGLARGSPDPLQGTLGEEGVGLQRALDDFRELVLPRSMGIGHPCYLGLVNSSPLPAAGSDATTFSMAFLEAAVSASSGSPGTGSAARKMV